MTAVPVMTLVAVSMNQVIHGRTRSPSASTSSGAWTWSLSQAWLRHDAGRFPNTSWARAASGPKARPVRSPAVRSRRSARRNVDRDGTGSSSGTCDRDAPPGTASVSGGAVAPDACAPAPPCAAAARATSWRWTAEALPCQYASSTRISVVISKRSARRAPECAAAAGLWVASASHRHTVRSEAPRHCPASRTCCRDRPPRARNASRRRTAGARSATNGCSPSTPAGSPGGGSAWPPAPSGP